MRRSVAPILALALSIAACSPGANNNPGDDAGANANTNQNQNTNQVASPLDDCLEDGGTLVLFDEINNNIAAPHGGIVSLAVSPAGQIAVAASDGAIKTWNVEGGQVLTPTNQVAYEAIWGTGDPAVGALAYPGAGDWIIAGDDVGRVLQFQLPLGNRLDVIVPFGEPVVSVAISPDGSRAAFADTSFAGNISLWNLVDGSTDGPLPTLLWGANALHFVPSDGALITAGDEYGDPTVELRDPADPAAVLGVWQPDPALMLVGPVSAIALTPDESHLVGVGPGFAVVLDVSLLRTGADAEVALATDPTHDASDVVTTAGGRHFAAIDRAGLIRLFDLATATGMPDTPLAGAVAIARDISGQLVTADDEGFIQLFGCAAP